MFRFFGSKEAGKMQWIQDPSQSNVDNLNNVRREVSRHFRNKKKAHTRAKIEELETNSKIKNIRDLYRGINDFKKGYQPRCYIVKNEKGDLVADSHSIVARWRNYFSQQEVEQYAWRFVNLLLLFGRRRNCLKSGRSRS